MKLLGTAITWMGLILCVPGVIIANIGMEIEDRAERRARLRAMGL